MKRRKFITLLGGAAGMAVAGRAQQRMRRIGILMPGSENDALWHMNAAVARKALAELGWNEGLNLRVELRFGEGDAGRISDQARELVRLAPEVILTASAAAGRALKQETQTIPVVVAGSGSDEIPATALVRNITRPEANITTFPVLYSSIGGKWLELLKQAAPGIARVGLVFNPDTSTTSTSTLTGTGSSYVPSIEVAAEVLRVKLAGLPFHASTGLESEINTFAGEPNGGLIVLPGAGTATRAFRQSFLFEAAKYKLPAIHWDKSFPADGGLMSYGSDWSDLLRRAAGYVDRLLRGAKVSELPVQYPTKFDFVLNLKAAKTLGLTVPPTLFAIADEVIE